MEKLKSVELGILGFEEFQYWEVIEEDDGTLLIQAVGPSDSPVRLALIHSVPAGGMLKRSLPNESEDNWFIICGGLNGDTINTRAPVIINGGTIQQVLTTEGSVIEPFDKFK